MVDCARSLGVTTFESAHAFGNGEAEELLGEALDAELRAHRERIVITTKGGLRRDGSHTVRNASPTALRDDLEASLRNLGTEYIDIYQLHWPDPMTPFAQTAAALDTFVREGKIRYVGLSNFHVAEMEAFSRRHAIDAVETPLHLLRRESASDILPFCDEHEIGVFACSPLAHGLLGGSFTSATRFAPSDWRSGRDDFEGSALEGHLRIARELDAVAREHGKTLAQLALGWTLAHPQVDFAIVASNSPQHLTELVTGTHSDLSSELVAAIEPIVRAARPVNGPSPDTL